MPQPSNAIIKSTTPISSSKMTRSEALHILGFQAKDNPTESEIKAAFRKKSLLTHPDRNPSNHEAFLQLNKAYKTLNKKPLFDFRNISRLIALFAVVGFNINQPFTLGLLAQSAILGLTVHVSCHMVLILGQIIRDIIFKSCEQYYRSVNLNTEKPAVIEALEMGHKSKTWQGYAKSFLHLPSYRHYIAFGAGLKSAMKNKSVLEDRVSEYKKAFQKQS